jgi:hypothetical protein
MVSIVLPVSACTHTTHLDPASPRMQQTRAALAGRPAQVTTSSFQVVSIEQTVLTASAIEGRSVASAEPYSAPLGIVQSITCRSRARGAWDWFLIGAAVNTAGMAAILSDEAGNQADWGLAALVIAGSTVPYVAVGAILGSTIRFQLRP